MGTNIYLTAQEQQALQLMAEGFSSQTIQSKLDIPKKQYPQFCASLRRKTGIADHKKPSQCLEYLRKVEASGLSAVLSEDELRFLHKLLSYNSHYGAAHQIGIPEDQAAEYLHKLCTRLGIFSLDRRTIFMQIRTFLAARNPIRVQEMSETHRQIMGLYAEGLDPHSIALRLMGEVSGDYVRSVIRTECQRAGILTRGRGAQRALIRTMMNSGLKIAPASEEMPEDPMNDPLF